ncbi:YigZ family protein [Inconstantimicrobium mannanitabidum]|uniref:YigZ family protein n=1 Tax=Inconstantimicrobium mannanitabidum TaxID=1604901 RepID=A0ACB5RAE2_9CLOT|nr:YigZ family protein [Clostridium sp. TW13]GKX66006.1 YigZ family protein [Clostridium sp. TW13]
MRYLTVEKRAEDEFFEKKSQFIGYIKRVTTEDEAKEFIAEIKSKHKDATHNCSAYVIGQNMNTQRYNDDGEPQGTAGIPILEVIKKNEITDCVIVVTRYFGGILLGTGGLNRAYTKGAAIAIKAAGIVEKVQGVEMDIILDYDLLGKIQYLFGQNDWYMENIEYTDVVKIKMRSEISEKDNIIAKIVENTNGKAIIEQGDILVYFKRGNRLLYNLEE